MNFRLLEAREIDCRIAQVKENFISLLLYKDARCDMNILDETVGVENWQRRHELINGNLFCSVGIHFDGRTPGSEWVWKQDVGTESYTEKEKGQASDAFKRACFNWGIGRELYTAPAIFIGADRCTISKGKDKLICYDRFYVSDIAYDSKRVISHLVIKNQKTNIVVFEFGRLRQEEVQEKDFDRAGMVAYIKDLCKEKKKSASGWLKASGYTSWHDVPKDKLEALIDCLEK